MTIPDDAVQREETRTSYYWERPDGIIVQRVKAGSTQSLADARANIATLERLAGGRKRLVLVDMRAKFSIEPGVREYYATPEATRYCHMVAMLIESAFGRIVGNLSMTVSPPMFPMRLFTAEADAIAWLLQAGQAASRSRM